MNELDLYVWSLMNRNDKLDALRENARKLDQRIKQEQAARLRLMAHLGLVELDGPRIVTVGSLETLG